jgi:rubrerythrin
MSKVDSVEALLELAITAEQNNKKFYQGLSKKFFNMPSIAYFWQGMVMEEVQHTQELENIRNSLSPEQLSAPADPSTLEKAKRVLEFSVTDSLSSIATLDDAYEIVRDLEHSEVNVVFSFIMSEFIPSEKQKEFIMWQLENHTQKIVKFSGIYGDSDSRKKIMAQTLSTEPSAQAIKSNA